MRRLLPEYADEVDLDDAYAHAPGVVRANFVASLDGAAWDPSGRSTGLSSPADKALFLRLRTLADVILVGATTVRRERYGPARPTPEAQQRRLADGLAEIPPVAVVSSTLAFDLDSAFFTEAKARPIVLTVEAAPPDAVQRVSAVTDVLVVGETEVDGGAALDVLAGRGLTRVLCEGGPTMLGTIAAAGRLDELALTIAPVMVGGDASRIIDAPLLAGYDMRLRHVLEGDGDLFLLAERTATR